MTEFPARAVQAVRSLRAQRIGLYGISFKPQTDDVRDNLALGGWSFIAGQAGVHLALPQFL